MGKFKKRLSNIKEQQKTKSNSRKCVWRYKKDKKIKRYQRQTALEDCIGDCY